MVKTHLRRLLDKLRRPDQVAGDQQGRPAPIDPAAIEARKGNVDELAGLPPSDCVDCAEADGGRLTPCSREGPLWSRLPVGFPASRLISTGRVLNAGE